MLELSFEELVKDLRQRRVVGDPPPALLLGAGASVGSGVGAMTDLFRFVGCDDFDEFCGYIEERTAAERYRLLAQFLQAREPAEVTPGYHALATLCAEAYFDLVLTTNLDPLLDDALAAARLWRKDYLVLVNGIMRTEWLGTLATAPSPRVKVIKLHGDLFLRCMAWTVAEMDNMVGAVHKQIVAALQGRDLLVVGHSLRDERIRRLVLGCKGAVWFTHPAEVPAFLADRKGVRAVVGPDCIFEKLFTNLAEELVGAAATATATTPTEALEPAPAAGAQTLDDLLASVVGVAASPDAPPNMTGFLLAEPRLIVTDRYPSNVAPFDPNRVTLVASGERRLASRFLRLDDSYAFGPLLLEAPEALKVPGLQVDPNPVNQDLEVRVAVAAGERVGLSSGVIRDPDQQTLEIAPIGTVEKIVAVDCVVAPGSSGAPVVDSNMAVRGFVVAGRLDRPPTFIYPAECWTPFVERA
jgi:hypothetical protein